MSSFERLVVKATSYLISKRVAFQIAKYMLRTQGVGWAGPGGGIKSSGEIKFLENYLKNIANPCIFDIGSNIGDYTYEALKLNPNANIHCFEPSKDHYKILRSRFLSHKNVVINHFGLSDSADEKLLYKDKKITGLASLIKINYDQYGISLDILEKIYTLPGDQYIKQNKIKKIDFLKIDVEGWEINVLHGLKLSFSKKLIKVCQFEFGYAQIERRLNFRDFYLFFKEQGYKIGIIKPNGNINLIPSYDEFYENYYASNFVAFL